MKEQIVNTLTRLDYSELTLYQQESIGVQLLTWFLVVLIAIFK